jgi:hypothetical protein
VNAPYFPALVASSCSANPMPCAAAGVKNSIGPSNQDALTDEVGEVGELGTHQIVYADPVPLTFDEQVLIGCECLQALREALDVILVVRT